MEVNYLFRYMGSSHAHVRTPHIPILFLNVLRVGQPSLPDKVLPFIRQRLLNCGLYMQGERIQ